MSFFEGLDDDNDNDYQPSMNKAKSSNTGSWDIN
jgi:hypothetical protein